jgi:DNA-binding NtrC family response regulator
MGESRAIQSVKSMIASVAPTEANVMIFGENGVGKELVARAIHQASRRAAHGMLAVDMGSLPEATFESELFGHRKGAFTDAKSDRAGRFQAASGDAYSQADFGLAGERGIHEVLSARSGPEALKFDAFKLNTMEKDTIVAAVNKVEGNISHAAKLLGISHAALYRKLGRHGF